MGETVAVPVFEDEPRGGASTSNPSAAGARWTELPVTVPMDAVLVETDRAIVYLTGALVFSTGLAFHVTALVAHGRTRKATAPAAMSGRPMGREEHHLMLGIEYPDGRVAHNVGRRGARMDSRRVGEVQLSAGGDYHDEQGRLSCFLSPLPPEGELLFAVAWPARGLREYTTAITVGDVRSIGRRLTPVPVGSAPGRTDADSARSTIPIGGWFERHLGLTDERR